ncbi:acyl carrier protein [Gloeobacter morelensis]|uniref:Acyl carrier protein n=1 Tax=Gloeobacter morelensis MG652769 TaxID=2781736 RepID=A0ABY3PMV6_9CYAN|nr:acyl carrier protein [Gloeobacter morelensis]UFP94732.1 acyl carrier protein [Gloeobacter morelensis MG652769]
MASKELANAEALQELIISLLVESLEEEQIDPEDIDLRQPLGSYGLSSVQALVLLGKLEKQVGFALSPTVLWNYPTIQALAGWLVEEIEAAAHRQEI